MTARRAMASPPGPTASETSSSRRQPLDQAEPSPRLSAGPGCESRSAWRCGNKAPARASLHEDREVGVPGDRLERGRTRDDDVTRPDLEAPAEAHKHGDLAAEQRTRRRAEPAVRLPVQVLRP